MLAPRPAPLLVVADFNDSAAGLQALADRIGGEVFPGRGPDHALGRDVELIRKRVLPKGSGDHHPVLYVCRADGERFKVLGWNVYQGTPPARVKKRLRTMIRNIRPDAFVLYEAYRCGDVLDDLDGYRVFHGDGDGEDADVAMLVRRDRKVTHDGVLRLTESWMVVRYDRWRAPRVYRRGRIRLARGLHLRLLGAHGPTDAPVNQPARRESDDAIVAWANRPNRKEKSR